MKTTNAQKNHRSAHYLAPKQNVEDLNCYLSASLSLLKGLSSSFLGPLAFFLAGTYAYLLNKRKTTGRLVGIIHFATALYLNSQQKVATFEEVFGPLP